MTSNFGVTYDRMCRSNMATTMRKMDQTFQPPVSPLLPHPGPPLDAFQLGLVPGLPQPVCEFGLVALAQALVCPPSPPCEPPQVLAAPFCGLVFCAHGGCGLVEGREVQPDVGTAACVTVGG